MFLIMGIYNDNKIQTKLNCSEIDIAEIAELKQQH